MLFSARIFPPLTHTWAASHRWRHSAYVFSKRVLDVLAALIGLILCAPLFLIAAIAIKLDSAGSVFFCQRRCGKGGREFTMIKLRSMCAGAEQMRVTVLHLNYMDGPMFKAHDDPRVTRVGRILRRASLDELPQFINVLLGQMSLVGPRPLVREEMEGYPAWRAMRLSVRPGITGLWQVKARSSESFADWLEYDSEYVKNQSFRQDFRIMWQTAGAMILPRIRHGFSTAMNPKANSPSGRIVGV
jgi:lipopolysaccharide/colanic/teichoic acid biosynthesis glycosyltransferase